MIWYQAPDDDHAHRGTVSRGRVSTACGLSFTASRRLADPPDHRICLNCDLAPQEHHDWRALLAVRSGDVTKHGDRYDLCQVALPSASLMAAALRRLEHAGKLTAEDQRGPAQVRTTRAGDARHTMLDQRLRNVVAAGSLP
ncbi:MAG: hypothetical protein ACRDSF_26015 [Pseudonocardiaceae bacterium]